MSFIHLRTASAYSFKYGTTRPEDLIERAAHFEMPALALTDRDNLAGVIRFASAALRNGVAPIIGINLAIDLSNDAHRASDRKNLPRITILSGGDGRYRDLLHLYRGITTHSPDRIPVLTLDILQRFSQYSSRLYLLHGPESPLAHALTEHRIDRAYEIFNITRPFFEDHAIETVSHLTAGSAPRSTPHAARMLSFARQYDIDAILTNAVRMRDAADAPVADVLDCARQLVPLHTRHLERRNAESYLKQADAMTEIATDIARASGENSPRHLLRTTREWAERSLLSVARDIGIGDIHLPEPSVVGADSPIAMRSLLRARTESALTWRYTDTARINTARARLDDELATIGTLGFESYFLTVADIADAAKARGIRVAARGSGAGSLVCHLLGISGVDPIEYGLMMERFCSPLRQALPDIDIDVESARRLEVYDLIFEKYGPSNSNWKSPNLISRCATVSMVEKYRARHAIRDAGAALGLPAAEINLLAKSMPHIRAANIPAALASLPELKSLNTSSPLMSATIALATRLDGLPRHLAMHPCAVALSDASFLDRAPIQIGASGYPMIEFDKDDVEEIGLLKLDVLGVRMQSTIAYAESEIIRTDNPDFNIDAVPLNDPETFELIQSTQTLGLFQIESPGQRELVGKLQPATFNDLIIDISLFRPGPVKSDMIRPFLNAREGFTNPYFIHPDLEPILRQTSGVVVFHEQVIAIIARMTGVSLATADEKRRSLGTPSGQQSVCDWFFPQATAQGYELPAITAVWDVLRAFASFGFCKAHAAAFALPTYQSAWLKRHYPAAFFAGVLTHEPGMYPRRLMLDEARKMGVAIAPLDVNASSGDYTVSGNSIRIGLRAVSGINLGEINSIVASQPYIDLSDFYHRSGASAPIIESLILTGAFDSLYINNDNNQFTHRDLLLHLSDLQKIPAQAIERSQIALPFAGPQLTPSGLPALTESERTSLELEKLEMDVTRHLLEFYAPFLNAIGAVRSCDLLSLRNESPVLIAGVKVALQSPPIRSGNRVLFLSLDDGYGCSDSTFFTDVLAQLDSDGNTYASTLKSASLFLVRGVTRRTGKRGISIRATGVWDLKEAYQKWQGREGSVAI